MTYLKTLKYIKLYLGGLAEWLMRPPRKRMGESPWRFESSTLRTIGIIILFLSYLFIFNIVNAQSEQRLCSDEILYGPDGIFQQPYVVYRGIKITASDFGVYHGEEFNVVVEAIIDAKEENNCMMSVLKDPESKIEIFVTLDDDYSKLEKNAIDHKEIPLSAKTKDEKIYDNNGNEIGSKSTYIIPYRFDKYFEEGDDKGKMRLGNYFFIVRITVSELLNPDTNYRVKYITTEPLPDLHIRKPEFASFIVKDNVVDLANNKGKLIFEYDLNNVDANDKLYIFYDMDNDGIYEIGSDDGYYFDPAGEITIECTFSKSGDEIHYNCSVPELQKGDGSKTNNVEGNLKIQVGSYSGDFFIALGDYRLDLDKDGTEDYYFATEHKSIPLNLCYETYSCKVEPIGPGPKSFEGFLKNISNTIFYVIAISVVLMIIIGGFMMLTSAGNYERIQQGKRIITYAIVGFIVALFANIIFALIKTIFS